MVEKNRQNRNNENSINPMGWWKRSWYGSLKEQLASYQVLSPLEQRDSAEGLRRQWQISWWYGAKEDPQKKKRNCVENDFAEESGQVSQCCFTSLAALRDKWWSRVGGGGLAGIQNKQWRRPLWMMESPLLTRHSEDVSLLKCFKVYLDYFHLQSLC